MNPRPLSDILPKIAKRIFRNHPDELRKLTAETGDPRFLPEDGGKNPPDEPGKPNNGE